MMGVGLRGQDHLDNLLFAEMMSMLLPSATLMSVCWAWQLRGLRNRANQCPRFLKVIRMHIENY